MDHGTNPLYEAKSDDLRVTGSNGVDHSLVLPSYVDLKTSGGAGPTLGTAYDCVSVGQFAGTDKGGNGGSHQTRASINTTRSNIKHYSRISCLDGTCSVESVVEVNGLEYDAVITGKFKKG